MQRWYTPDISNVRWDIGNVRWDIGPSYGYPKLGNKKHFTTIELHTYAINIRI